MLSNLINCSKTCHHSNGRWVYFKKKKKTKLKQLKTHTSIKESKGSCLWQTAEEMCLYSLLRVVHPVQRMDLIQEFITKLQMQSLFVFWHQRGPRKWIGVWTNWHHSHKRRGKKFSKVEVVSSFSSSLRNFQTFSENYVHFFVLFTLSQCKQLRIYFIVQAIHC